MAVNKLQAALAAATNEVTVAAANLNFDFTLVKYEAPKEYQALGSVLSTKRKDNAEHGSSHITARQLGALFEGVCPQTPSLLEAYGTRASEIAKASKSISEPYISTLFAEYTGIDGTSIWAAATSSKSALHVHLLACMLARMWTAPEAVAIWVELVAERKRDIAHKVDEGGGVSFSLAAAVGQEITRPQLADWDASARAWLHTADAVQQRNQKQLELILKNLNFPISGDSKVFSSVITAWSAAVETMDKLVAGMPQQVQNGATLLGLSAWHLYPDMSVFGPQIVPVKMNDPLIITGGVLSLGLSATPRTVGGGNGVYWSLSLAHLRHYGRPVRSERALRSNSRITFPQLSVVVFSALLAEWGMSEDSGDVAAKAIIRLADYVKGGCELSNNDARLLQLLRDGASAFADRSVGDQDLNRKLIQLGRRRASTFFHKEEDRGTILSSSFFFDLLNPICVMEALKDCDARIAFLRHIASQLSTEETSPDTFVIRYLHDIPLQSALDNGQFHTDLLYSKANGGSAISQSTVRQASIVNHQSSILKDPFDAKQTTLSDTIGGSVSPDFKDHDNAKRSFSEDGETQTRSSKGQELQKSIGRNEGTGKGEEFMSSAPEDHGSHIKILNILGYQESREGNKLTKKERNLLDNVPDDSSDKSRSPKSSSFEKLSKKNEDADENSYSSGASHEDEDNEIVDDSQFNGTSRESSPESTDRTWFPEYSFATALPLGNRGHTDTSTLHRSPDNPIYDHHRWLPSYLHDTFLSNGETWTLDAGERFKSWDDCVEIVGTKDDFSYGFLLGDTNAALYARREPGLPRLYDNAITVEHFQWCMDHNLFDPANLLNSLLFTHSAKNDRLKQTLVSLAFAAMLYDDLPGVSIDVGILSRPLVDTLWARDMNYGSKVYPEYDGAFSLISYFESGVHDIDPTQLKDVIALSSTNSLFVSLPVSTFHPSLVIPC